MRLVEHAFNYRGMPRPECYQVHRPELAASRFAWYPGIIVSVPGWDEVGRKGGDWDGLSRADLPMGMVVAVDKDRIWVLWDFVPFEVDHLTKAWLRKLRGEPPRPTV